MAADTSGQRSNSDIELNFLSNPDFCKFEQQGLLRQIQINDCCVGMAPSIDTMRPGQNGRVHGHTVFRRTGRRTKSSVEDTLRGAEEREGTGREVADGAKPGREPEAGWEPKPEREVVG